MISRWFGRKRPPIADRLHAAIVAASRRPAFYGELGVPDSVEGRFELLCLHLFLFLRRTRGETDLAELAQEVLDRTFADLDRNLREAGVGDLSVPKRMQRLAGMFYARVHLYAPALESEDEAALAGAVSRAVLDGAAGDGAARLAAYMMAASRALAAVPAAELLAGELAFIAPREA